MRSLNLIGGSISAWCYNEVLGHIPSRTLRRIFLGWYLGSLGNNTNVQMHCRFLHGRNVHLGNRVVVNFGTLLDGRRHEITIGSNVSIGPKATVLTLGHDPASADFSDKGGAVVIKDHAWLAYGSIVLPGTTIGEGAIVAAGTVVSKDVEPYNIMAGNPARCIGQRPNDLHYELDYRPFLI
ncbi:MAG: acetyltransferase [Puniceicoccaceae bacterium]